MFGFRFKVEQCYFTQKLKRLNSILVTRGSNMANNRKKQKKKQDRRKKAVAKAKKQSEKIKNSLAGGHNISFASNAPIYECLVPEDLFESGIGQIIISRKLPNGNIAASFFLLDVFCLGIKDAFGKVLSVDEYNEIKSKIAEAQKLNPVSPAYVRKLVENGEAYAKSIGLHPHSGYARARKIFGNIDVKECQEEFTFGQDGKPLYVNGPYDSKSKIETILNTLTKTLGEDGFEFALVNPDMFEDDEDYDDEWEDDDDYDDENDDDESEGNVDYRFTISNNVITISSEPIDQVIDIEATDVTDNKDVTFDKSKEK